MIECAGCHATFPLRRGGPLEDFLYRVMLLDDTRKSYFCDPACYDALRAKRAAEAVKAKQHGSSKKKKTLTPSNDVSPSVYAARDQWRIRVAPMRKYLQRTGPVIDATAKPNQEGEDDAFSTGSGVFLGD